MRFRRPAAAAAELFVPPSILDRVASGSPRPWRLSSIIRREPSGLRGVGGGAERVGTHVRGGCGLPGGPGGCGRCRGPHLARWDAANEADTNPFLHVEFAARKSPRPCDELSGSAIVWNFRLEDSQHVLGAICSPTRDDPSVGFAECLR